MFSKLIDVLNRREFLYRKLNLASNNNFIIPEYLDFNNNFIINDFKDFIYMNKRSETFTSKVQQDNLILKSQYQPLRKGITNMIRIQADKAIAMPIETRLQILAVSKDIIHS